MLNSNFYFDIGNVIKIQGVAYRVTGFIAFEDDIKGDRWFEYKLIATASRAVSWLSVDTQNNEYAMYTMYPYNNSFSQESLYNNGYKEIDNSKARVVKYSGDVDVDFGENVNFIEYEDTTEEFLMSIEDWNGDREYSKGYYINKDEITLGYEGNVYTDTYTSAAPSVVPSSSGKSKKLIWVIVILIILIPILMKGLIGLGGGKSQSIRNFIENNSNFTYVTSITSDLDSDKKADVFGSNKTVEETAKLILDGLKGSIDDVQEDAEDKSVIITTEYELALIYTSEDAKTLVQVSSREYVYSSRTSPYRSRALTTNYYRRYYYTKAYTKDSSRYKKSPSGYSDYNGGTFISNDSNKYKTYSQSVRQSSTSTRTSSGGGVSSGK